MGVWVQEASSGYLEVQETSNGYLEVQEASSRYVYIWRCMQEASGGYLEVQEISSVYAGQQKVLLSRPSACMVSFLIPAFTGTPLYDWFSFDVALGMQITHCHIIMLSYLA